MTGWDISDLDPIRKSVVAPIVVAVAVVLVAGLLLLLEGLVPAGPVTVGAHPTGLAANAAAHGTGHRFLVQGARATRELRHLLGPDPKAATVLRADSIVRVSHGDGYTTTVEWNGGSLSLGLRGLRDRSGTYEGPQAFCLSPSAGLRASTTCHQVENADWVSTDDGSDFDTVTLFTTDGWRITVTSTSPGGSAGPVLTLPELQSVAQDGDWFE